MTRASPPVRTFRLPDPPGVDVPGDGITCHWHPSARPGPRAAHGIVVLPILAGDYAVSTTFARAFASAGYQCLRFERRAEWLDAGRDPEILGPLMDRFVDDVRRGIARWTATGGPAAPLGLFGVSMGAITGTVVAAREPAIGPAVLCLGGGPLARVLATARDTEFDRFRADLSARLGDWHDELVPRFARAMAGRDPVELAGRLDPARVLFVGTAFDRVVRPACQRNLWQALGRPRRVTLPSGHYAAALFIPWIRHLALRWFDRHLASAPSGPHPADVSGPVA